MRNNCDRLRLKVGREIDIIQNKMQMVGEIVFCNEVHPLAMCILDNGKPVLRF